MKLLLPGWSFKLISFIGTKAIFYMENTFFEGAPVGGTSITEDVLV